MISINGTFILDWARNYNLEKVKSRFYKKKIIIKQLITLGYIMKYSVKQK